ncbi:MAG: SprT family zinc-dependent metalloprotease [Leptolinea sp.]
MKIDQLIRSRRKTVALIIQKDGRLVVRAPLRTSLRQIEQFVVEKTGWIKDKQEQVSKIIQQRPQRKYISGESFLFQGKSYPLEIINKGAYPLTFKTHFIMDQRYQTKAESAFTAWYKIEARRIINQRTAIYATRFGYQYHQIRITSARTRWGSCSIKGNLSFSWRLIMAPLEVIDYVIIHELAHVVEHNHSRAFWDRVKNHMPEYQNHRRWLKENGHLLTLD